ncbi:MAG: glycosyl hydrolase family 88 [Ruminiclostridium sp.]|nr:glycosyl hydrolase family 88 [Ruminiclostridium sp.]
MKIYVLEFNEKAELLKNKLLSGKTFEELEEQYAPALCISGLFTVFFSVCNTITRAKVVHASASTLEQAWHDACKAAVKYISLKECKPVWVKADIMCKSEKVKLTDLIETISKDFNEFYRHGISFDPEYKTALIEAEINGNRVISYKEKTIKVEQVNRYLPKACGISLTELPEEVITFDCRSALCDENKKTHRLYWRGMNIGRRVLKRFEKKHALDVITTSSTYLSNQLDLNGKFEYGVYPIRHSFIPGYNILRHASSLWSLICAYRITGDAFILKQVEGAIGYLVKNSFYKYKKPRDEENTAFIADIDKMEVKLGGNGLAIIMLTEYMNLTGSDKYVKLCQELANGILELLDKETGEFTHVLSIPDLNVKAKMRTVYYDGEAVFGLTRLYGITKEQRWLDAASLAVDRFIREDYTKYRDHWVGYAMNEITKYKPTNEYLSFALRNAQVNLKKIHKQRTTYHTYLELLCITFELYDRIITENLEVDYLKEFDVDYFVETIFHRAHYMLNGYAYPEYAMYLKYPEKILGSFFVRHDGYRIRIDDIQHFCGAYYSLYRNYEKLDALRTQAEEKKKGN